MEKRVGGGAGGVVAVLVIFLLANGGGVNAQAPYSCWGGCYNKCYPRSKGTEPDRSACYYKCINSCIPRSPASFRYYCEIGCSLKRCIPVGYDGARMESCFGRCTNICKS